MPERNGEEAIRCPTPDNRQPLRMIWGYSTFTFPSFYLGLDCQSQNVEDRTNITFLWVHINPLQLSPCRPKK